MLAHGAVILKLPCPVRREFDRGLAFSVHARGCGVELVNFPIVETFRMKYAMKK